MDRHNRIRMNFDGVWKEGLRVFPDGCLKLFCPAIYDDIDWTYPPVSLDKELQKIVNEAEVGTRFVDKLFKVRLKQGDEAWVYIHIEFQAQKDQDLPQRMYIYYNLLYFQYKEPILSLAILGDKQPDWRPNKFETSIWGCTASLVFPIIKLWDYRDRIEELKQSRNPFAFFVIAHLKTLEAGQDYQQRLIYKKTVIRDLLQQGFSRKEIRDSFKLIDGLMVLPKDLEQKFLQKVSEYQEEMKMTFMAPFEILAMEKGVEKGSIKEAQAAIIDILKDRFGKVPMSLRKLIKGINNLTQLRDLRRKANKANSLDEFSQHLQAC